MNPEQWPTGVAVPVEEMAELMGLGVDAVRRLTASGLPCIRLADEPDGSPPLVLYPLDSVRQWLADQGLLKGVGDER